VDNSFTGRLERGEKAELKFQKHCDERNLSYCSTKKFINWTNEIDLIYGDYIILSSYGIFIDVKGSAISKKSIERFEKDYFLIYENSYSGINGLVFENNTLKELIEPWDDGNFDILPSKDLGIWYGRLSSVSHLGITVEEFLNNLI
jgi:hypothetical protein